MKKYTQGDVRLVEEKTIPADFKKDETENNRVVAYGETSGHAHVIDAEVYRKDDEIILDVKQETELRHILLVAGIYMPEKRYTEADHAPIPVEPGIYRVKIHKQYNPYSKLPEKVVD